jgi:hypothetical protein
MASALVDNGKNVALDALAGVAVYASLHTGAPSTTGANEVTGGSPAYARKGVTWAAAAAGVIAMAATFPVFDVPASTTVAYVGLFSALTAGTFYGYWDVTDEVFASAGLYTLSAAFTITL